MPDSGGTADPAREARFRAVVVPELPALYAAARAITRHAADAEDVVQDTLLRAYRGLDGFDGAHPRAWLLTILRNAAANRVRRRRPGLLADPDASLEFLAGAADPALEPESVVVDAGFDTDVAAALAALGTETRAVLSLVDVEGLSYKEAAARLGIPVGTVMSRLHRARRQVRAHLDAAEVAR